MKKRLKINGIIMVCGAIVVAFFSRGFMREYSGEFGENMLEILGFALIFLGQIIRVSARGYKAEHSDQSRALIQGGPYQVVRNPMYLGIILIGLGVVVTIFQWWAIIIFALVFIVRYILLIFAEENKLRTVFSQSYKDYCKKVPRLFPNLLNLMKLNITAYLPIKLAWFQREIGSMVTLILIILLAVFWNAIYCKGLVVYLKQLPWLLLTLVVFGVLIIMLSKQTAKTNENISNKS